MAYAELGSAFPEAGGGYLWVKEGVGGVQGFLAGWMNWFAAMGLMVTIVWLYLELLRLISKLRD